MTETYSNSCKPNWQSVFFAVYPNGGRKKTKMLTTEYRMHGMTYDDDDVLRIDDGAAHNVLRSRVMQFVNIFFLVRFV